MFFKEKLDHKYRNILADEGVIPQPKVVGKILGAKTRNMRIHGMSFYHYTNPLELVEIIVYYY